MDSATLRKNKITIPNPFNPKPGDMVLDPKSKAGLNIKPGCNNPLASGLVSVCASSLRTANTQAKCGAPDDYYFYSPWLDYDVLQIYTCTSFYNIFYLGELLVPLR
jgi:hypothetical protein